jgi:hypothetical protein
MDPDPMQILILIRILTTAENYRFMIDYEYQGKKKEIY